MHLNKQLYSSLSDSPLLRTSLDQTQKKVILYFKIHVIAPWTANVFSSQKSQEIPSPKVSLPKLAQIALV